MQSVSPEDMKWMQAALELAAKAELEDEVPVGAVAVFEGQIVGTGYNQREGQLNPLAHAEILAIQEASKKLGRWRLSGVTLYVTLEPCTMCAGALVNSRVERVVFGATDPKGGAAGSLYNVLADSRLNHRPQLTSGILAEECGKLLSQFFKKKRS